MNNKNVRYAGLLPDWVKECISQTFCMGWNEVSENEDLTVRFVNNVLYEGFTLNINGQDYFFDINSQCYMKHQ